MVSLAKSDKLSPMKNIIVCVVLFVAFSACTKGRKISGMNGEYPVTVHFHRTPYRSNIADTILKDFDTVFQANVTISGYEDTITMTYSPTVNSYPGTSKLVHARTGNDTMVYRQTYPPVTNAGYGTPAIWLYFKISNRKIYYREEYSSGHDGSYLIEMQQY